MAKVNKLRTAPASTAQTVLEDMDEGAAAQSVQKRARMAIAVLNYFTMVVILLNLVVVGAIAGISIHLSDPGQW